MQTNVNLSPAFAAMAAGRDYIQTSEFALIVNRSSQTIRKSHCLYGECFGIRPVKIGNRLLWPVAAIGKLLKEGHK